MQTDKVVVASEWKFLNPECMAGSAVSESLV